MKPLLIVLLFVVAGCASDVKKHPAHTIDIEESEEGTDGTGDGADK